MIFLSVYAVAGVFGAVCLAAVAASPGRARSVIAIACHAAALLALLAAAVAPGVVFDSETYFGDLWTAYEAVAKSLHGLRSSLDYFSPIGPVYDWMFAAALRLQAPSAAVVPFAGALAGGGAAVLSILTLRRCASPLGLALATLAAVAVAVSPREIDAVFARSDMSLLAPYNRWAWALFIPVALRAAIPVAGRDPLGAAAMGLAIALMLLLKVTYGAAALGLLVAGAILRPGGWRDAPPALLAMTAALGAAEILSGQVSPYFGDLATAAAMEANGLRIFKLAPQLGEAGFACIVALIALALTAPREKGGAGLSDLTLLRAAALIVAVAGAGCAILMQNHYVSEAAVYALLPLIAVEWTGFLRDPPDAAKRGNARPHPSVATGSLASAALLLGVVAATARPALIDVGFVLAQQVQFRRLPPDPALAGTPLADLIVHPRWLPDGACSSGVCKDRARMVSGRDLLLEAGAGEPGAGTILALNFSNPFPMLLGAPPPSGAPIWLHADRSFSAERHVAPEVLFEGVGYVMVARGEPNAEALTDIYAPFVTDNYRRLAEDPHWTLWVADGP